MNTELPVISANVERTARPRKAYHTPRLENYGAVNELTRSGGASAVPDAFSYFSSFSA